MKNPEMFFGMKGRRARTGGIRQVKESFVLTDGVWKCRKE